MNVSLFFISFLQQYSVSPLSEVKRPSSISACPLKTDETIALVTEKVRKMDARLVRRGASVLIIG